MNQNLKLRIMTALIGVPVILWLLLGLGIEGVAFFAWVISLGMMYEFCQMFFHLDDALKKTYFALILATFFHAINYLFSSHLIAPSLGLLPVFFFSVLFLFQVPALFHYQSKDALLSEEGVAKLKSHVSELMALCFGMVYCVWFPLLLVSVREFTDGKHWVILGLLTVWSSDTFAYFAGKYFGKNALYEIISPKKTWEGAVGGTAGALLVAGAYGCYFIPRVPIVILLVIILLTSAASVIGDLCESMLKRASNVKDSGSLLPGHGGFLDRFDGVIFAFPALYGLIWMLT